MTPRVPSVTTRTCAQRHGQRRRVVALFIHRYAGSWIGWATAGIEVVRASAVGLRALRLAGSDVYRGPEGRVSHDGAGADIPDCRDTRLCAPAGRPKIPLSELLVAQIPGTGEGGTGEDIPQICPRMLSRPVYPARSGRCWCPAGGTRSAGTAGWRPLGTAGMSAPPSGPQHGGPDRGRGG